MRAEIHPWEASLLNLAHEAQDAPCPSHEANVDRRLLEAAYAECGRITAANSKSFFLASSFLHAEKRKAARALYAFCRRTDDIVDGVGGEAGSDARAALEAWRNQLASGVPPADDLVALAWFDTRRRFSIPGAYADQFIRGVSRDLTQTRYATFDSLASYSYGVASTVGLMTMHIVGYEGPQAIPYAIKLGVALQLTNVLRDVGEDWALGRLYLPLDEMAAHGVREEAIAAGRVTPQWKSFIRDQIARARRLYDEAYPGIAMLNADGRLAIAAAADFYRAILTCIEENGYDNLSRRACVSGLRKASMLPGIWLRSRRLSTTQTPRSPSGPAR